MLDSARIIQLLSLEENIEAHRNVDLDYARNSHNQEHAFLFSFCLMTKSPSAVTNLLE